MRKEMNHRFGFYLMSALMMIMLIFIYIDVQRLNQDIDQLLESARNGMEVGPLPSAYLDPAEITESLESASGTDEELVEPETAADGDTRFYDLPSDFD